jgi:hypothetical protein
MKITIDLDQETFDALEACALSRRRSPECQAEVFIRQRLHLPYPFPAAPTPAKGITLAGPGQYDAGK